MDPRITTIVPDDVARPGGHYSHAMRFGDLVFTSGQLGARPELHYGYHIEIDAVAVCRE